MLLSISGKLLVYNMWVLVLSMYIVKNCVMLKLCYTQCV